MRMRTIIAALVLIAAPAARASATFNGTDQYYQTAAAVVTTEPLTIACWIKADNTTDSRVLVALCPSSGATIGFRLMAEGAVEGDPVSAGTVSGLSRAAKSTTGFSAGAWHHITGVFTSRSSRRVLLDGNSAETNSEDAGAMGTPDRTTIATRLNEGTAGLFFAGSIAEVGIWNAALTDAEALALARGISPLLVRPSALVYYAASVRGLQDVVGGVTITAGGSPTIGAHPRVYR